MHQATSTNNADEGLEGLLAYNESRIASFTDGPFCQLIRSGTLDDPVRRETFLACLQLFSRQMQTLMFARQATCADPKFSGVFLQHLSEEIGHDRILAAREGSREASDAVLTATLCWFCYQMMVVDNVDKAALAHLVLESAGDVAYRLMAPILAQYTNNEFFSLHAEVDPQHAAMGVPLLSDQHPATYGRLRGVVEAGWNMLDATTMRIVELVDSGA